MCVCVLTLAVAPIACTGSTQEEPAPAAGQPAAKPAPTVVEKPILGEAEHTFSLSVPFESVDLAHGEQRSVRIGINRGDNFGEEVEIQVSGLPMGVTMETDEPVITQGNTGVEIMLKADDDAALGHFTVKVTGHTASSGEDYSKEFKVTVSQK
jgi:uncharacterized membrane protein